MARMSKGRRKVEMRKMSKESNLLVTFSKRREGVFKKASELCTLCSVQIALIVFSPSAKVFSFGHPSVEQILNKFLPPENPNTTMDNNPPNTTTESGMPEQTEDLNARTQQLNMQLKELYDQLEALEKEGVALANERNQRQGQDWWEAPVETLGLEELQTLRSGLMDLKNRVAEQTQNLSMMQQIQNTASSSSGAAGREPADGSGPATGIFMTPQGYALLPVPGFQ